MARPRRHAFHTSDGWREITGAGDHPGDAALPDPLASSDDGAPPDCPGCQAEPEGGAKGLTGRLGQAFSRALEDLDTALVNDPAARSRAEVLLTYPGVHALWLHRISHALWRRRHTHGARLLSHVNRFVTGIEIHPGARIGRQVFIDHGMGIVVGETAWIGDGCLLYKGVVLGGTSLERTIRHPHLGRNVVVGSNACVLGAIHLGDGAKVGSGSVVIRDVPPGATVVGVPGRVVLDERGRRLGDLADHEHADLPDPVAQALGRLSARVEALEAELEKARGGKDASVEPAAEKPRRKKAAGKKAGATASKQRPRRPAAAKRTTRRD
jgi:serine O-acetyltransferase